MVEGVDAPRRHGCVENYQAQRLKSREWLRRRLPTSWGGMWEAFSGGNKGKVSLIFRAEGGLEAAGRHQIDRHHHVLDWTFTYAKRGGYMAG
jgi:hypothetical protein